MAPTPTSPSLDRAWRRQALWSQVAGQLKRAIRRARLIVLGLSVVGAVLAALAAVVGVETTPGRVIAFAGAASIAFAGIMRSRSGPEVVRDWAGARSVSEAIKAEVYLYLTAVGDYREDRDDLLAAQLERIEREADGLLPHTLGVDPKVRGLPDVHDVETYIAERVTSQIDGYYRPQAQVQQRLLGRARTAEFALALAGAALAAAAGTFEEQSLAVWVPVVTTVSGAVAAHAAAQRYEFLLVEYLRTAAELQRLLDRRGLKGGLDDENLVRACERVLAAQNQTWTAKLAKGDDAAAA